MSLRLPISLILFSTAPPPTQIYTLSLHDALPISQGSPGRRARSPALAGLPTQPSGGDPRLAQRADRGGGAARASAPERHRLCRASGRPLDSRGQPPPPALPATSPALLPPLGRPAVRVARH